MTRVRAGSTSVTESARPGSSGRPGFKVLELERGEMLSLLREALDAGAMVWVGVKGSSMVPAIPVNASVRLRRADAIPRIGDVVLAVTQEGLPLLHRVIAIKGATVQTLGDRLLRADNPLPVDRILGIADLVATDGEPYPIPEPGRLTRWLVLRRMIRWFARLRRKLVDAL